MNESLSQKTLKNALWQVFNLGWTTVLNFLVTPLLLQKIGVENYGVYVLILTIISFLSLLDFGMGAGFANSFIEYTAIRDTEKKIKLLNSFIVFRAGIGLLGLLLLFCSSFFAGSIFGIRGEFLEQTQYGFWFAGMYFAVFMASTPFSSVAISVQRFDILGKISFVQNTVLNFLLIVFALLRPSLTWMLASHLFSALASFFFFWLAIRKIIPELKIKPEFHWSLLARKLTFSGFNFVSGLANNFLMQVDRFFISRMLGNYFLAFYTIPNSLAQKIYSVAGGSAATLYPVATDFFYHGEKIRLGQSFRRAMRVAMIFSVLSGVILMVFGRKFLQFWVGDEIASRGAGLIFYFVPIYILFSLYEVLSSFYFGLGKSKILAGFSCFMAFLNIILLVVLIPIFGLSGVALAFLLAMLPVIFLIFIFEKKELTFLDSFKFYFLQLFRLLMVSLGFIFLAKFWLLNLAVGLWQTLALMILGFFMIIGLYIVLGFVEKEDWELIRSLIKVKI